MHWRETKARRYETLFSTNDKVFFFYEDGGITRLAVINPDAIAADPEAIKKRMSDCETLSDQVDLLCSEQKLPTVVLSTGSKTTKCRTER